MRPGDTGHQFHGTGGHPGAGQRLPFIGVAQGAQGSNQDLADDVTIKVIFYIKYENIKMGDHIFEFKMDWQRSYLDPFSPGGDMKYDGPADHATLCRVANEKLADNYAPGRSKKGSIYWLTVRVEGGYSEVSYFDKKICEYTWDGTIYSLESIKLDTTIPTPAT